MAFNEYQSAYAEVRIPVFPCGGQDGKKPLIKNYNRITLGASSRLAGELRFEGANIGLMCGPSSGLTILDIDDTSERFLADTLSRYGESPIVARTGSGKFQAWYSHNGEKRSIRPSTNLDILGGGMAVVPLSKRPLMGSYEFIQGGLHLLPALQPMAFHKVEVGSRTNALFMALKEHAGRRPSIALDDLVAYGDMWNLGHCAEPLPDAEIIKQASGVMRLLEGGRCWVKGTYIGGLKEDLFLSLSGDAVKLYHWLRVKNHNRDEIAFAVEGVASALGWSPATARKKRDELVLAGLLKPTHKGGAHKRDANRYTL